MLESQNNDIVSVTDGDHDNMPFFDDLGIVELANIFGFLAPKAKDIIRVRLNKKMRDAAMKTIVAPTNFYVDRVGKYNGNGYNDNCASKFAGNVTR